MVLGGEPRTRDQGAHRQSVQFAASRASMLSRPAHLDRDLLAQPPAIAPQSAELSD
jgi:hypothetical protein